MTPDERQLIDGLFERLRGLAGTERDGEAEAYIGQLIRQYPYAPYLLAQTAIVNEHALGAANARVQELEAQVAKQGKSGSFLGGLFGGGQAAEPPRPTSVPVTGARPQPYAPQPSSPWGGQGGGQPGYGGQGYGAPPPQGGGGGGGFLRGAMTTAAGVAGGMILADSIRGMMGGHGSPFGGHQGAAPFGATPEHQAAQDQADDDVQDAAYEDNNDPGTEDVAINDNSGGGWDTDDV